MRQLKRLRKTYKRLDSGIVKLRAGACLVMAGCCFQALRGQALDRALDWLDEEIEQQILPDGGHISRSAQTCVEALEILIYTDRALEAAGLPGSKQIRRAIDRLSPMVGFMRAPDGGLFAFNGSGTGNPEKIATLLATSNISPKQFGYAPHMKYQRLDKNGTVLMMDIGGTPDRPYDLSAHLAPMALEVATEAGRLLINCGWNIDQPSNWREIVRTTAAHSTLILNNTPDGQLLGNGLAKRLYGPAVKQDVGQVIYARREEENGVWLESSHDGYCREFGLMHRRRVYMDILGRDIRGEDRLAVNMGSAPRTHDQIPFAIRFHIHPSVKVSLAQDQNSALLIQPGKLAWRLKTDGGPLILEKSVCLSSGSRPQRCEQIVISGRAYGDSDGQTRSNRVRWSLKKMGPIES